MYICSEHDNEDIAHEGGACPACTHAQELKDKIEELNRTIARLESDCEDYQTDINNLDDRLRNSDK